MREYARRLDIPDVEWRALDAKVNAVARIYQKLCTADERCAANELMDNWWRGAAHLHPDLTAEELASMLLDGYDVTKEVTR